MIGDFEVFPAGPGDGGVVGEIHAESWRAAYAEFFSPEFFAQAVERRRGRWHRVLAEGEQTVLLAASEGRPLAYSAFAPSATRPGAAEILGFYAHPDGWGGGAASALMAGSLQRIRQDGFGRVHLWTLRGTPRSRRFYTKCGFAESGAGRSHDYGDGNPIEQVEYELALD
ncbi:GNAT family N-acetyltransferase [Nocardiopsis potens]|uniref:GNAT family N-acetyltransferase n=1 Tax=Nocardiopsis potens TaxID=1246458 RepID=UPI000348F5EF|nr:GNAT family N-acetyltransferase [Nocardiopsis potens]